MKAHASLSDAANYWEFCAILGNSIVDEDAKAALAEQVAVLAAVAGFQNDQFKVRQAAAVARAFAATVACFPPILRERRPPKPRGPTLLVGHAWQLMDSIWRCSQCFSFCCSEAGMLKRANQQCAPPSGRHAKGLAKAASGHVLCAATLHGSPFFFCARCGNYLHLRWSRLAKPCTGAGAACSRRFQRMLAGCHPLVDRAF